MAKLSGKSDPSITTFVVFTKAWQRCVKKYKKHKWVNFFLKELHRYLTLSYFFQEPAIGFYDFFVDNKVGLKELAVRISVTIRNSILTELFSGIYVIFKWHR